MPTKLSFSDQLRQAILRSEKSRYAISQQTGIPQGNLSHFMHGRAGLSLATIDAICKCIGARLTTDAPAPRKKGK